MEHLDTRQLRAFVALADCGSFTEAARQLHLTQSAVSHAIKSLETSVRCRLFDRIGKTARLSLAGEQLLMHARVIFREMESAAGNLQNLGKWGRARLRLAATPSACQYLLPHVLREFKESFPLCQIVIEPGDSPVAVNLLAQNRVDLALALIPRQSPNITSRKLIRDNLAFVVSPLHPWARVKQVPLGEIARQNFVLYNKSSVTFQLIEHYFSRQGIELRSLIELGNMEAIKELVKLNLGVSILPAWLVRSEVEAGSLLLKAVGKTKLQRDWAILHRKGHRLTLPEETFVGLCQAVMENVIGKDDLK